MDKTGGLAFPSRGGMMFYVPQAAEADIKQAISSLDQQHAGMTLRDYFAAKAMNGLAADSAYQPESFEAVAATAYRIADSMLAERAK